MADNHEMVGATIVAKCLAQQDVGVVFGIVGIPVIEVAAAIQAEGIRFVAMRNEQAVRFYKICMQHLHLGAMFPVAVVDVSI